MSDKFIIYEIVPCYDCGSMPTLISNDGNKSQYCPSCKKPLSNYGYYIAGTKYRPGLKYARYKLV